MKPETYKALLKDLQKLQKTLVASQIEAVRADTMLTARITQLHAEAEVGGRVDDFVATAARKSTVLFLLRSVFVRVLEDLGILGLKRIRDDWGFAAFREVAPALGFRAYFAFVFCDLALDFPALFSPVDDELPLPTEDGCRALWNLWHHPNRDGEHYVWNGDGFDSRFLGDLYEDLDADIRKRYALRQTPRFVEEYVLDQTLTPALAEFDPATLRRGGETFRVLDPTCGSGHFLIGAFHRLADYWRDRDGLSPWEDCKRALEGVWGCDINPHAAEIAAFRLLLELVARTGEKDLERLAHLTLNVRTMDSLVPWERSAQQGELFPAKDRLDAYATPKQRRENSAFLAHRFHAVVGNPPYITPKDKQKSRDYKAFWPSVCTGKFPLSVPFAVRFFDRAVDGGFIGQITSNSFLTRRFGKDLIEKILPRYDIARVVDASLAPIPGHGYKGGVPTILFFGRNRRPVDSDLVIVVAKRREGGAVANPALSQHWLDLVSARPEIFSALVECKRTSRAEFFRHPIVFKSAETEALIATIERRDSGKLTLGELARSVGIDLIHHAPELFEVPDFAYVRRMGIEVGCARSLVRGDALRDYSTAPDLLIPFAYDDAGEPVASLADSFPGLHRYLWPYETALADRWVSGGVRMRDRGFPSHAMPQYPSDRHLDPLSIGYAFVATHAHFSVFDVDRLFEHSAAVIKLRDGLVPYAHYACAAFLNSSTGAAWLRAKFKSTGTVRELWESRLQIDGTKLRAAPVLLDETSASYARELHVAARDRASFLPAAVIERAAESPMSLGRALEDAAASFSSLTRRMVALQEELDWLTYASYALIEPIPVVSPTDIEPMHPGHRPFEIVFARQEEDVDEDDRSSWWAAHGHERVQEIPDCYSVGRRAQLQQRIDLIESDPRIALLETTTYKRRWQPLGWASATAEAAESWLLDRLEELFAPGTDSSPRGPLADPKPYRLEDVAAAWARDRRVAAVAGVWTGTGTSVDLTLVAEELLSGNALPDNPHRLYSPDGLRKLAEWKRVWALQDQQDDWQISSAAAKAQATPACKMRLVDPDDPSKSIVAIQAPPKFEKDDFAKAEYISTRGKLNVPRERFIQFEDLSPRRFGWSGWRDRDRALAQVEAFSIAETEAQQPLPVPTPEDPRRCGVTLGLWESLPDVKRWGSADEHAELQALAREACRQTRCPCPVVEAWRSRVLLGSDAGDRVNLTKAQRIKVGAEAQQDASVSLAERAWVASLFHSGKELDLAGVWTHHHGRVSAPPQSMLPGLSGAAVQLTVPALNEASAEQGTLDELRLALVLDDLVASGDLQATGRGKKRGFRLVVRGGAS